MSIAAFNVFDFDTIRAVIDASNEVDEKVYLQFSASTIKYYGADVLAKLIRIMSKSNSSNIILHLDHCTDLALMESCVENGWNSIMGDFSHLTLSDNIQHMLEIKKMIGVRTIAVEGELGQVSGVEDGHGDGGGSFVNLDDVVRFVDETKIDLLAIGIGNAHGFYKTTDSINIELLRAVHKKVPDQKLVLHGGTGIEMDKINAMKVLGIEKINISTELKDVYLNAENHHYISDAKFNMISLVNSRYELTKKLAIKKILEFK